MDTKKVLKTTLTTLLAIALIFGSGIGIAKAASNAYCTLKGGMESANKAAASMKNNQKKHIKIIFYQSFNIFKYIFHTIPLNL